jgi:acetyl esterase/lipase
MAMLTRLVLSAGAIVLIGAATASANEPIVREVHWGAAPEQELAVYEPANAGGTTVVSIHGGGWNQQKAPLTPLDGAQADALADHGFTVFDVNFRQDSETLRAFPMEVEDVVAATHYAIEHAAAYRGNPANVVLIGFSSGGHLVQRAAEVLGESVRGVISLSGPTNLVTLVQDVQEKKITSSLFTKDIGFALGCDAKTGPCEESYEREWSPIFNISTAVPAWLLFSAEIDLVPVSQAKEMDEALTTAGATATLTVVPGKGHSITYWSTVESQVVSFINEH